MASSHELVLSSLLRIHRQVGFGKASSMGQNMVSGYLDIWISGYLELGGAQLGNRFFSFVRAHARSGSEVGIGKNGCPAP